jgi:taurine transport system substrate-binding protein
MRPMVVGMALAAAAALGIAALPSQAAELEKVTTVGSSWPGHSPIWMAIQEGYFKAAGFDVSFRQISSSMDRVSVISSGDAKFGGMGAAAMLPAMAQGNQNFYWVGSPDAARTYSGIVAREQIKSLKDLKGKRLAVQFGGSEEPTDYMLLQKVGLDAYKDLRLVNMPQADMIQALKQGNIDAAGAWSPEFEQLQKVPGAHTIASVDDLGFFEKYHQMPVPDVLLVNKQWADKDPARAKRFLDAYFKGMAFVMAHPKETTQTAITYTKQPADVYSVAASKFNWLTKKEQCRQLSKEGAYPVMDQLIDFMVLTKKIDDKPDYKKWVRGDLVGCSG